MRQRFVGTQSRFVGATHRFVCEATVFFVFASDDVFGCVATCDDGRACAESSLSGQAMTAARMLKEQNTSVEGF